MTQANTPSRVWDAGRKAQGFKSQEHLDAFYVYYDHFTSCDGCNQPGPSVLTDDGWQGTVTECPDAIPLRDASWAFSDYYNKG
jgi:hypothetical protein